MPKIDEDVRMSILETLRFAQVRFDSSLPFAEAQRSPPFSSS
jgi:hypothetical protein